MNLLSCDACNERNPGFQCGRCRNTFYCCKECQEKHYSLHKLECVDFSERGKQCLEASVGRGWYVARKYDPNAVVFAQKGQVSRDLVDPVVLESGHAISFPHLLDVWNNRESAKKDVLALVKQDPYGYLLEGAYGHLRNAEVQALTEESRNHQYQLALAQLKLVRKYALGGQQTANNATVPLKSETLNDHVLDGLLVLVGLSIKNHNLRSAHGIIHKLFLMEVQALRRKNPAVPSAAETGESFDNNIALLQLHHGDLERVEKLRLYHGHVLAAHEQWKEAVKHFVVAKEAPSSKLDDENFDTSNFASSDSGTQTASTAVPSSLEVPQSAKARWVESLLAGTRCYLALGDMEGAQKVIDRALEHAPKYPGVHMAKADVWEAKQELEKARTEILKATALEAPWDPFHHAKLVKQLDYVNNEIKDMELKRMLEEKFVKTWGSVLQWLSTDTFETSPKTWSAIQTEIDVYGVAEDSDDEDDDDDKLRTDTRQKLEAATVAVTKRSAAIESDEELSCDEKFDDMEVPVGSDVAAEQTQSQKEELVEAFDSIRLTRDVLKWMKDADTKFRGLFIKKVKKLAEGIFSYTTAKPLKGSDSRIFETYLENKSGHRIIWTGDEQGLLIWYVAAHKKVSRYMKLIDDAANRGQRQLTPATELPEIQSTVDQGNSVDYDTGNIMLDPKGDVPLKIYSIDKGDVDFLNSANWRPQLHLTPREREIVETQGTICLLGRSGTGKTVCICNRIDYDRHNHIENPDFTQLFVARSQRICNYVQEVVGGGGGGNFQLSYCTYQKLLSQCETVLIARKEHPAERRMDFYKFKKLLHSEDRTLDPLVAWTQIRSFIKGSMHAVNHGRPLTLDEYRALGKKECRISDEKRVAAYGVFERYREICKEEKLWDDNDRVAFILRGLSSNYEVRAELTYSRLYVDEIQDYTQAEVALFFMMCKPGGLFLAGDPAQSVEEGVDFRFEDVRVVANKVYEQKKQMPEKPKLLKVNFRSHAGVLNLAAGVLENLFRGFPGSAKELPKDEGLFRGPLPCVLSGVNEVELQNLVEKQQGVVVLTMDEPSVAALQRLLGDDTTVMSIRESKGLEFNLVLIVNFFKDVSGRHQKEWKTLFLDDDCSGVKENAPEIETQLKQLYTAVTRCCKRLLFAETGRSMAYDAFVKWSKTRREVGHRLIEELDVRKVEGNVMSKEEWRRRGITFASAGEENADLEEAEKMLSRALSSFRRAGADDLVAKAQAHVASVVLRQRLSELNLLVDGVDELVQGPEVLYHLLKHGLQLEAKKLATTLVHKMDGDMWYTQQELNKRLLMHLPNLDY